jgi:hypothetical protein
MTASPARDTAHDDLFLPELQSPVFNFSLTLIVEDREHDPHTTLKLGLVSGIYGRFPYQESFRALCASAFQKLMYTLTTIGRCRPIPE